jgi:hypothetical protein
VASTRFEMLFDRGGKAVANESKYPFIVEVPVNANRLDVKLNVPQTPLATANLIEWHRP